MAIGGGDGGTRDRTGRRGIRGAALLEAAGVAGAMLLALVALSHLLSTSRSWLLFFDGDSVILPLVERSLHAGQPFEWAMSTTVFLIEIPVYLVLATLTANPFLALTVNAVLNLLALYLLTRLIAGMLLPHRSRALVVAASVASVAVPILGMLLESTADADSFELFSLLTTTTYYYPSVLAILGSAWIVARLVAPDAHPHPHPHAHRRRSQKHRAALLVGLGILATVSVTSNPLFGVWSAAPAVVTLLALAALRRLPWRVAVTPAAVLVAGCVGGVLLRRPLAPFLSMDPANYLHIGDLATPLRFYGAAVVDMAGRPAGVVEMLLLSALAAVTVTAGLYAIRMPHLAIRIRFLFLLAAVTVAAVALGAVLVGTTATRYLQPVAFAPLLVLPVLAARGIDAVRGRMRGIGTMRGRMRGIGAMRGRMRPINAAGRRGRSTGKRGGALLVTVVVAVAAAGTGLGLGVHVFRTAAGAHLPAATCLERWLDGRDLTGAGQFWAIRGLKTYGTSNVHLLQIDEYLQARPWMVNLADYDGSTVSYLIVDDTSLWGEELVDTIGSPRQNVSCGTYTILDYSGTQGEKILTERIAETGKALRTERGFTAPGPR